jgi:putative resolvase
MRNKYPNHLIIKDIGSGMNLNKRGIRKIINLAINGNIEELVIAHKDRLTRFGYELIINYSHGVIIIENKLKTLNPHEELVTDVYNIFVEKINGLRRYK